MIYTKPLYMIRVSSFASVTLTIGYNVIPKEELPLITKKTFVSIDLGGTVSNSLLIITVKTI